MTSGRGADVVGPGTPPAAALISSTAMVALCWRGRFVAAWAPFVENSEPSMIARSSW